MGEKAAGIAGYIVNGYVLISYLFVFFIGLNSCYGDVSNFRFSLQLYWVQIYLKLFVH